MVGMAEDVNAQPTILEALQSELSLLYRQIDQTTSYAERARLWRRVAEITVVIDPPTEAK